MGKYKKITGIKIPEGEGAEVNRLFDNCTIVDCHEIAEYSSDIYFEGAKSSWIPVLGQYQIHMSCKIIFEII